MSNFTLAEARAMVMDLRSNADALAGVWRNPKSLLDRGPGIAADIAGQLGVKLAYGSVGEFVQGVQVLSRTGTTGGLGAVALVGQFVQYIQRFTGWLKGEFESAAEQTAVNYGAAQAFLMSWVPLQGKDEFPLFELPGFNAHGNTPNSGGFYLFVRPLKGDSNDRSDFYGDPMSSLYNWILQVAGLKPIADNNEEGTLMSHGCQNAVDLLAGDTCTVNPQSFQVFWPVLFPLYSPARLWGYYSRFGEPIAAIATAANMLTALTPQHIAQREELVTRAEKVLRAVVASQYPWVIETPDGWVQRPDKAPPQGPRFDLASANQALARCRQFRVVRESLKRVRKDAAVLLPGWALSAMDENPDFIE